MSRIVEKFEVLRKTGRKGFIPYITAGDPSLHHTRSILDVLVDVGADLIEVGVPFSDPLADGPVIQRASQRALASGTNLKKVLELVAEFNKKRNAKNTTPGKFQATGNFIDQTEIPFVLFSYLNPIWQMGIETFARNAKASGVDGVLLTDLTPEEAPEIKKVFDAQDLDLIFLVAPTSTDERITKICSMARGFIYAVSRTGTTGTREALSERIGELVTRTRKHTHLPVAVGFGISSREQVKAVWNIADGAVVGSAIVQTISNEIMNHKSSLLTPELLGQRVEAYVRGLIPER